MKCSQRQLCEKAAEYLSFCCYGDTFRRRAVKLKNKVFIMATQTEM